MRRPNIPDSFPQDYHPPLRGYKRGSDWAPAWVRWRRGEAVIGWSPMPPDVIVGDVEPNAQYWVFVAPKNLVAPNAADVILPPAAAKIDNTVVVNQTVIRRNNGVRRAVI
jgi:hypothetical protein